MMKPTILVTGAPRSGTTPLGQMLSTLPGAFSLYEPMGPTGDQRIRKRFPIPGESDFSEQAFDGFLRDLECLDLRFKHQRRPGHRGVAGLAARLFGTRSLLTYRLAKVTPGRRLLIWKDPHAVFCAPFAARFGFRAVVSIRSPYAHAASFKRLGWVSQVQEIYSRWRVVYGDIPDFPAWIERFAACPVGSASLLWHLVYSRMISLALHERSGVFLLNMEDVAGNEQQAYENLFAWLGEPMPIRARKLLANRRQRSEKRQGAASGSCVPGEHKVHDFDRTAEQANNYWRDILTESEIAMVREVNEALWGALTGRFPQGE